MFTLTRISDGQEYTYVNKEEFAKMRVNERRNCCLEDSLSDMLDEMKHLADFIKESRIIEDLDHFIERYCA